ncbi:hypothetical protein MCAMS1_00935 [biofilm metagenome]
MLKKPKAALKSSLALLLGLGFLLNSTSVCAETPANSTVIAAIVLNLARFTEWPETAFTKAEGNMRLCVLGDNITQSAFGQIDNKQIGTRSLAIINMPRLKNPEECQLLYTSDLDRATVIQLLAELRSRPIFTISSDESHFLEDGGMVLLKLIDGKMNIEINLNAVTKSGLKISSRVLQLAKIVNH